MLTIFRRHLKACRVIRWVGEPFGTVEMMASRRVTPSWIEDGREITLRQEIRFTNGETINILHPAYKLRLVNSGSRH